MGEFLKVLHVNSGKDQLDVNQVTYFQQTLSVIEGNFYFRFTIRMALTSYKDFTYLIKKKIKFYSLTMGIHFTSSIKRKRSNFREHLCNACFKNITLLSKLSLLKRTRVPNRSQK